MYKRLYGLAKLPRFARHRDDRVTLDEDCVDE